MNHVYRKIWSRRLNAFVVVAENVKACGKSAGGKAALLGTVMLGLLGLCGTALAADTGSRNLPATLPSGGQVVAGSAQLSTSGSVMTVTQGSAKAVIDWQSFSVGSAAQLNFVQPDASSAVLNRVLGPDVSVIQGRITANGQVFLVNPNGVLFTPTAQVNVGTLVASTLALSTDDFMAGNYRFGGSSGAGVTQQGQITATGGTVALIAARIVNSGQIGADGGRIGLAAGASVTLDLGGPVLLRVSQGALDAAIEQSGGLRADGGRIFLTAQAASSLAAAVINHSGVTQARTLADVTGQIELAADLISHTGSLEASATASDHPAQGGSVALRAKTLIDAGRTDVSGTFGGGSIVQQADQILQTRSARLQADGGAAGGGSITLLGGSASDGSLWLSGQMSASGAQGGALSASAHRLVAAGAAIDTSGSSGAGSLRLGGGWQGQDSSLANAQTTVLGADTTLTNRGSGGSVVVWSDQSTVYGASLQAPGSVAEVSSGQSLVFAGKATAASLLLDPKNITIQTLSAGLDVLTLTGQNGGSTGDGFGAAVVELSNTDLVITAPLQTVSGVGNAGAVYHYTSTGSLVSVLTGSAADDNVGFGGVTALTLGNYVVRSPYWDNGGAVNAGAVTWGSGTAGVSGVVSAANSLVGGKGSDCVGFNAIVALSNGNYVVRSQAWDNGSVINAGAVTWGSGTAGVSGVVSSTNSLVGSKASDGVGNAGLIALSNGNYVVLSTLWDNGTVADAGAVTWASGTAGLTGVVSSSNSLVGSRASDNVGLNGLTELSNGSYVVRSQSWDNGTVPNAGAVTWGSGTAGISGAVSSLNSLVGSKASDSVGSGGVVALNNGSYVVRSPVWDNATVVNAGAVTWGSGTAGVSGVVSSLNSLVGSKANDSVGSTGVTALTNGNYVVLSAVWDHGSVVDAGAVTWGSGMSGVSGAVSSDNSLVGSKATDCVGIGGVTALSNGNYVVRSPAWDNGSVVDAGAVTWGSGTAGVSGVVSAANSLVGSAASDSVGSGALAALSQGNYVVASPNWDNGSVVNAGAVTWGNGAAGVSGVVSSDNSLVGSSANDGVGSGSVFALSNGNYVVRSPNWDNGSVVNAGASTWGNGTVGRTGAVSAANSLVGSSASDSVGTGVVVELGNGNYVVTSYLWDNGSVSDAGAATWVSGTAGISGVVSSANSLVGAQASDCVGSYGVTALSNGHYVVLSGNWSNGSASFAGAATWGDGTVGISGVVSSVNSLVGSTTGDLVGSSGVLNLSNGNYAVPVGNWTNGSLSQAGAVTWGSGTSGVSGVVSASNSVVGTAANQYLGTSGTTTTLSTGSLAIRLTAANSPGGLVHVLNGPAPGGDAASSATFSNNPSADSTLTPATLTALLNAGTAVTLQANNDITVASAISTSAGGAGGSLTLQAGRSIAINAAISTDNGHFTAVANSRQADTDHRDAGAASISIGASGSIQAGTGTVTLVVQDSGSFVNAAGASAITAGEINLYLPTWNTDSSTYLTLGGLTQTDKRYNTSYSETTASGTCHTSGCSLASGGLNVYYAAAPVLSVTPTSGQTSTYGSSFTASGYTLSGFVDGDTSSSAGLSGTAVFAVGGNTSSSGHAIAGSHDLAYSSGLLSGLGYQFQDNSIQTGELTVAKATISAITGITASSKTYDGNTVATLSTTGAGFTGLVIGDNLSVGTATGSFSDKNAAIGKAVAITGLTLAGTDADNYTLSDTTASTTATISRATISAVTGITASDKTYDGSTVATLTTTGPGFTGLVNGDSLSVGTATGSFSDKNAGTGKAVAITGLTLAGTDAANYTLSDSTASTTATINRATISAITGITASDKTYDGSTVATLTTTGAGFTGIVNGDSLSVGSATGSFSDKNAGSSKTVSITGLTLAGTDADNYMLSNNTASTTATISRATISAVTGITASDKTYDGSTVATLTTTGAGFTGLVNGDSLNVASATGSFSDKNAGSNKAVSITGLSLAGTDADNYTLSSTTASTTATINRATISAVTGITASDKTYDGNTVATLTTTGAGFTGLVNGDTLSVGAATGTFSDKNAASSKTVTITGLSLAGTDADNYTLSSTTASTTATINKATISGVTGITANDKTYDGSTVATLTTTSAGFTGIVNGDTLSVGSATGTFSDKNAASSKTVAITGLTLAGTDAANYTLSDTTASTTATISRATISAVTGITASDKTYDGSTVATLTTTSAGFTGLVNGDSLNVASATGSFSDKNAGSSKTVTITGLSLAGTDADNYTLSSTTASTTATISRATISAVTGITAADKTYDGSTVATLTTTGAGFTGLVNGDSLNVASATGSFSDKNAGSSKTVSISGLTLAGTDADNYTLSSTTASTTATISKATISAVTGITAADKTYDGSTVATLTTTGAGFTGLVNGDSLNVASATGSFSDKNAGSNKAVSITGLSLAGTDADNYTLSSTTASTTATINRATISAVTGITASDRTYDGSAVATLTTTGAGFTGLVNGDSLNVASATGSFSDKNAGSNKTVSITGLSLAGTDADNYTLSSTTANTTATINKATISGVMGITANDKTYDDSTVATLTTTGASFTGLVNGDSLSVASATGSFSDKNAGSNKTVSISWLTLAGTDADNYTLSSTTASTTATINRATISAITGVAASDKTYDGSTVATLTTTGAGFTGLVNGDSLSVGTATGSFSDKNAGSNKAVTITGLSLAGTDADNYTLSSTTASTTATINKATITAITGITASDKTYDGSTNATLNISAAGFDGLVRGDNLAVSTALGHFSNANPGQGKTVVISGLSLSGRDASNYRMVNGLLATATANITAVVSLPMVTVLPTLAGDAIATSGIANPTTATTPRSATLGASPSQAATEPTSNTSSQPDARVSVPVDKVMGRLKVVNGGIRMLQSP